MGYSANQAFKRLYEGKLIEISQDKKSAERWVEILELPQSDTNNVQHLRLDIYRVRFNVKAEKKADFPIDNSTVLGIERGTVQTDQNDFSRYITIFQVSKPPLRFQMDERICTKMYEILRGALDHCSFRVYQNSPNVKQQDLVVHATSQYISTTKVTQLKVQEHWDLRNVCQVSHHDRCVGITIFGTDLAGSATGYKEFTLKNESFAAKFAAEIGERLSKVAERGSNEYTTGPTVRENFATSTPSTSPTLALAHPLQGSNLHISERVGLSQSKDNVVENVTYAWKLDPSEMAITHHAPAWKLDSSKMAVTHHPPPPLPKRKPQPEPRRKVEEASHPQPPQGATPLKKETHNGEPPRPSPRSPTYTRSNSEGCGIDSWRTFVSHLGVEEEEIASISVSKAMYPVRDRCRPEIKRSDRASIVPKRPKARSGDCIKPYGPGGATSQPKSNYSLYPFLFHVWNSEEIIADTLGMSLLTWQDFVVYFELSSSSFTTMNDWKGLAERIGMSPVDIQVIDNYSRRFNQCASAIVMLFWQHNAPHLNEEYTRPVLLKILSDLEREDLIDVILKGKG